MKYLKQINEISTSLNHNIEELSFVKNQNFNKNMNFKDILNSSTFSNEEEFDRIKIVMENIFLKRIHNLENELMQFNISKK